MYIFWIMSLPYPQESLGEYIRRLRTGYGMSQLELATIADVHIQSLGKIERGKTTKLNHKTMRGLAYALQIPSEYLDSVVKQIPVDDNAVIKFCPCCWSPGTPPEMMWTNTRSQYCFLCGTKLRNDCANCHEPITSLKFRFCPYCGSPYKTQI
jgi:DNA-binding XRE family transcriptional regulator